ncbi:MAG TPA: methyltransferase domain-containing protein [Thermoguttaceae bacterium]|nr:methyltransferase domain-containing protein [Thermoguttaceae bacterium]
MSDPILEARPALAPRLAGALRRRLRYAWSRLTRGDGRPPVEAALDWLLAQEVDGGLPALAGDSSPCPAVTGACIETALALGCRDSARRWAHWLVGIQRDDGSIAEHGAGEPSFRSTACALRGFLAIVDDVPEVEAPARRACHYLSSQIDVQRPIVPCEREEPYVLGDPRLGEFPDLGPLWQAGRRWGREDWTSAVERAVDGWTEQAGMLAFRGSLARCTQSAQMLLDLERRDVAQTVMDHVRAAQRRNGSVPQHVEHGRVTSAALAHAAVLWYRVGSRNRAAGRAMQYLERRRNRTGGFALAWGRLTAARSGREDTWAVKYYLDAALLRVRAAFEERWQEFPDEIDPNDGRMQAVRAWLGGLPPDAKVADVGCGKGRFVKHLAAWFPEAQLTGIDFSQAMLAQLPSGVVAREGSLLRIPAADGEFDGAFAVESLEHALVPERAVAELCRVVRPGGRVLVIDKHRAKQPLSEHDPWERWFLPEELALWLGRYCEDVSVEPVAHSEGRGGSDLFLAARGRRRMDKMD